MFDQLVKMYLDTYQSVSPIDHEKMDYFIVYRLVRALFEGKEGQKFWTTPSIVDNITSELEEMTGIQVII